MVSLIKSFILLLIGGYLTKYIDLYFGTGLAFLWLVILISVCVRQILIETDKKL